MSSGVLNIRAAWRTLPPLSRGAVITVFFLLLAGLVAFSDWRKGRVRGDFTQFSLAASRTLLAGGNPYLKEDVGRNYKYLPANAVLLFPFAPLPDPLAQGCWFALNTVLLVLCARCHFRDLGEVRLPGWLLFLIAAVVFRLVWMNLKLGQWNLPVYCLALIGVHRLHRDRLDGGLWVGLAATLKYMPVFFALYFALRREWKKAGAVGAAVVLWALVLPSVVLGPARHGALLQEFAGAATARMQGMTLGDRSSSLSLRSTVYRMLSPVYIEIENEHYYTNFVELDRRQAARIADGAALGICAAGVWFTWRVTRRERQQPLSSHSNLLLAGGWFLLFLMASPGVRHAQLLSLCTPLLATAALLVSPQVSGRRRLWIGGGLVLAAFLISVPAELNEEARYQCYFEAYGSLAGAMMVLAGLTVIGLRELKNSGEPQATRREELTLAKC